MQQIEEVPKATKLEERRVMTMVGLELNSLKSFSLGFRDRPKEVGVAWWVLF